VGWVKVKGVLVGVATATTSSPALTAQLTVRATNGTISGIVIDTVSGQPVAYALIISGDHRRFASDAGRFVVSDLAEGPHELTVTQIGYGPHRQIVRVTSSDTARAAVAELRILLWRQALVLPELRVTASRSCARGVAPTGGAIEPTIGAALENAERVLVLEEAYPFKSAFVFHATEIDDLNRVLGSRVSSLTTNTESMKGYRPGRVLERSKGPINYFTTSDLARPAFRNRHCFWHAGVDTVDGRALHLIDFAPTTDLTTPDWAGRLTIDGTTARLTRSEASLVNFDTMKVKIRGASCIVSYAEVVPTIIHETSSQCQLVEQRKRLTTRIEQLRLVRLQFLGRKPGDR